MKKNLHLISYRLLITIAFLCFFSKGMRADDTTPDTWENLASEPANWSTSPYPTTISISSAEELAWVAKMVNDDTQTGDSGEKGFEGVTISLKTNLDLSGHLWIAIGKDNYNNERTKLFKGTFNGENHTIQNMTINTNWAAGLFGHIENATIQNVNLTECSITKTEDATAARNQPNIYTGCIAGSSKSSDIKNCSAKGSIKRENSAGERIGGIVGWNNSGTVDKCTFEGSIKVTPKEKDYTGSRPSSGWIGGIAGINSSAYPAYGSIKDCHAIVKITSEDGDVGGITQQNDGFIGGCTTKGTIQVTSEGTQDGVGGIAGINSSTGSPATSSIENCNSSCDLILTYKVNESLKDFTTYINKYAKVGGIAGYHWTTGNRLITKCTTSGTITVELITEQASGTDLNNNAIYAGGIVGYSKGGNKGKIEACESSMNISASTSIPECFVIAGGITGLNQAPITECSAFGKIIGKGYYNICGGITGCSLSYGIINCQYNSSMTKKESKTQYNASQKDIDVSGTECYAGGIVGMNYGNVQNSYSTANIVSAGNENYIGGLIGENKNSNYTSVHDCYATGDLASTGDKNYVGGIAGSNLKIITNCYATGQVEANSSPGNTENYAGGIVGNNQATVQNCLAINVSGITNCGSNTGRIIGTNGTSATTTNNYAHPEIPGNWNASETNLNGNDWNYIDYPFASSDAWSFTDDQLPKLKKINADGISYSEDMVTNQPSIPLASLSYYTVKFDKPDHGTITVIDKNSKEIKSNDKVQGGTELTITATPEDNYKLDKLMLNDALFTSGTTLIVSEDITISATFIKLHTVTIDNPEHGTITVVDQASKTINTNDQVPEGSVLTITATPKDTYQLDELTVNSTSFSSGTTWTVSEDITISATFSKTSKPDPKPEPDPTPVPPIYHTVTLPQVEGATTDPVAGQYEVEAWSSFRFYLTLDKEYDQSSPIVTTDRGETITPRSSDGAYIIKYVRQPIAISIDGIVRNPDPVANETISTNETTVRAEGAYLHLHTSHLETVFIYTFNGTLLHKYDNLSGDKSLWLPQGNYIVIAGNKSFKIQIQK